MPWGIGLAGGLLAALTAASGPARAQPAGDEGAVSDIGTRAAAGGPGARLADREVLPLEPPVRLRMITPEDGLPQSQVEAIAQDPRGFLWLGTQEGLARYDGERFVVYRHVDGDAASLPGSHVTALVVDGQGRLWVGTYAGLARYDDRTDAFVRYHEPKGDEVAPGVTGLAADAHGQLWVGTNAGLARLGAGGDALQQVTGIAGSVNALAPRKEGGVWVWASDDEGKGALLRLDGSGGAAPVTVSALDGVSVTALLEADAGTLWIGTADRGLLMVDPSGAVKKTFRAGRGPGDLTHDQVRVLFGDRSGTVWVGTEHGLNRYDPDRKAFVRYARGTTGASSTFPQGVLSLLEDRTGLLWIGTISGIRVHDPYANRFHHFRPDDYVDGVAVAKDGTIWITTYSSGVFRYDRARGQTTIYRTVERRGGGELRLAGPWLTAITVARDGTVWLSGEGLGLVRFDPQREVAEEYPIRKGDIENPRINYILESRDGLLWLATFGGGLVRFDPRRESYQVFTSQDEKGVPTDHLYMVVEDRKTDGLLWLAGVGAVAQYTAGTGTTRVMAHDRTQKGSLSHEYAVSLYQDEAGGMWVGTYGGGLNYLPPVSEQFEHITTREGLPNDTVYGILADDAGALWLSTNGGGLVQLDPKSRKMTTYTAADGLQGNEFIQLSFARSPAGELLFGGTNGFNVFQPKALAKDLAPPPLALTGIKLYNEDAELPVPPWHVDSFEFDYDSVVTFEFAALSFSEKEGLYAYRVVGLQDDWIETPNRSVTLSNLDGGDYTFQVKAANRHGVWNEEPISLSLVVNPPLYLTWWAFGLYGLLAVVAGLAIWRYQRGRLESLRQANRLASVERDLEITGTIQAGFLPQENPVVRPALHLIGLYRPAGAASGDWWWYEEPAGSRSHNIMVGDVTGHGPGPAIVTAAVATAFRVQAHEQHDLSEKLIRVNREVLAAAQGKFHVVLSAVEIDDAGRFMFRSAGGLPLVQVSRHQQRPKVVNARGTPLGTENFSVGSASGELHPGDRVYLFTDGIVEQRMSNGRQIGMRRLVQMMQRAAELPLQDAAAAFLTEMDLLRQNEEQEDDWTLAMFEWRA